jgi:hypothetical protein
MELRRNAGPLIHLKAEPVFSRIPKYEKNRIRYIDRTKKLQNHYVTNHMVKETDNDLWEHSE